MWFLNAFWEQYKGEAEKLWKHVQLFNELDLQRHAEGSGLDELGAHRFLEQIGETHTVAHHRDRLRKTGAIGQSERPKTVPLIHYVLWRYEVDWHVLVNTSGMQVPFPPRSLFSSSSSSSSLQAHARRQQRGDRQGAGAARPGVFCLQRGGAPG